MNTNLKRPLKIKTELEMDSINGDTINKLVAIQKGFIPRYSYLQGYYEGRNKIAGRVKKDLQKPNNKVISGYGSYIVDLMQGMFVGKPITYTSTEEEYLEELQSVFNINDEQDENSELAKIAGIKGVVYEIVYTDENADIRFDEIDPASIIVIYNTSISPKMIGAIRLFTINDIEGAGSKNYAEVYTDNYVITFLEDGGNYIETGRVSHPFRQVPVIEYLNNDEFTGDFERVISYIDAYDKTVSDSTNDFEEFTDAFLVLNGMQGTTEEDALKLKENRILLTDGEKQGAYWLVKELNDTALENHKNRLNADIHKFSKIPDMSDESFSGNASGVALEHKLLALEQVLSNKERKFKKGLQKRIKLITTILNLKGNKQYNFEDISISFTRNKPVNIKEAVEIAGMLLGFTSTDTALAQLPMIDNVQSELEKIDKEKSEYGLSINLDDYGTEDQTEEPQDTNAGDEDEPI